MTAKKAPKTAATPKPTKKKGNKKKKVGAKPDPKCQSAGLTTREYLLRHPLEYKEDLERTIRFAHSKLTDRGALQGRGAEDFVHDASLHHLLRDTKIRTRFVSLMIITVRRDIAKARAKAARFEELRSE